MIDGCKRMMKRSWVAKKEKGKVSQPSKQKDKVEEKASIGEVSWFAKLKDSRPSKNLSPL